MSVRDIVDSVVKKYKTRSPYELADLLRIKISRCELGSIHGYYLNKYRIKQIVLNCDLNSCEEKWVLAHEIGHAIMHQDVNTPFLKANTLLSTNKYEIEANKFAAELLISDDQLEEYKYCSLEQISRILGYHEKLIRLRFQ